MPPKDTFGSMLLAKEPILGVERIAEIYVAAGPQSQPPFPDDDSGALRGDLCVELASADIGDNEVALGHVDFL